MAQDSPRALGAQVPAGGAPGPVAVASGWGVMEDDKGQLWGTPTRCSSGNLVLRSKEKTRREGGGLVWRTMLIQQQIQSAVYGWEMYTTRVRGGGGAVGGQGAGRQGGERLQGLAGRCIWGTGPWLAVPP